jgi:hypothetical protein
LIPIRPGVGRFGIQALSTNGFENSIYAFLRVAAMPKRPIANMVKVSGSGTEAVMASFCVMEAVE